MTAFGKKIQVIVVDDHKVFRIGLKAIFHANHPNIEVVGDAEDGNQLFALLHAIAADVILLDINLPGMNGVEITHRLRHEYPNLKILAISAENTAETVKVMIEAGIDGFISKQHGDDAVIAEAIHSVMDGAEYFGRDISAIIYELYVSKKRTSEITPEFTEREKEIILLSRDGLQYKEIAKRLNISVTTVNTHKQNIFLKLGISNTMEMVQYALKKGIIKVEN